MEKLRLLAVSDAHNSPQALELLHFMLKQHLPDCLLVVGDLTNDGPLSYGQELVGVARAQGVPVFAEGGNMDPAGVHDWLEAQGISMHARAIEFKGYKIVGVGGSNPTPFNTPVEYSEEQLADLAGNLVDGRTVFAPHAPPFNTCADRIESGAHVGSKAIREIIEREQPVACLCGHIHEAKGEEFIGKTKLIKLQPLMWGKAVLLELPSLRTKFIGE